MRAGVSDANWQEESTPLKRRTRTTTKLDPLIFEYDTKEDAEAYDVWFRKKVPEELDDQGPDIPHEAVMDETDRIIQEAEGRQKATKG
ncbi:stability determinant [Caballeronia sp. LZ033]|uniref:type II toxin-antitoxin system RelB family antitoxin n=1 Tax=Caballeronia sp. LZ033 TaxID=3038566 RepID=UPI0038D48079